LPQVLFTVPHCLPRHAVGFSLQPPQLPSPHVPHVTVPPQPFEIVPQLTPRQVRRGVSHGRQVFVIASHLSVPAQVPQLSWVPQPSSMVPQVAPTDSQVRA